PRTARRRRRSTGSSSSTSPPSVSVPYGRRRPSGVAGTPSRPSRPRRRAAGWRSSATPRTRSSSTPWRTCSGASPNPRGLAGRGGGGELIRRATLVRKGAEDWGLWLGLAPEGGPDDLVFDLTNRRFSPDPGGWTAASAGSGEWQTHLAPPTPRAGAPDRPSLWPSRLWIYERGKVVGPGIAILPDRPEASPSAIQVTAHGLLPPGPAPVPIVAIAADEPMVGPTLSLHNGATGERFRQLNGHTGTIRSLAFSQDGRFLVSAAEDRTVCVWSLIDVDQVLGKRGALPGLALTARDGRYVVASIREGGTLPGQGDLRVDDVIEEFVDGQGLRRPPSSALDIHLAMSARSPGQAITLRRRRDGQAAEDIAVVLGQAVDERKPLL